MLSLGQYAALSDKAIHPSDGKAFIDFFLGDESVRILAKMGEFVNRKGIYPPLADGDKIKAVEVDDFDAQTFKGKDPGISEDISSIGQARRKGACYGVGTQGQRNRPRGVSR